MTISRVYSTKFLCDFDMGLYPFDTQKCQINMIMKGNTGSFAQLIVEELKYLGPIDLTQYFVYSWNMEVKGELVEVEIVLGKKQLSILIHIGTEKVISSILLLAGRRILNEILITYLPTMLICFVAFSTHYFKAFFFEAVVTVNLTSLLVLTTLFISVSNSLPKTSYIKMIDIWLLFVLNIPFVEVILHTTIDMLR